MTECKCNNCNNYFNESCTVCPNCGYPQDLQTVCPKCGFRSVKKYIHCPKCKEAVFGGYSSLACLMCEVIISLLCILAFYVNKMIALALWVGGTAIMCYFMISIWKSGREARQFLLKQRKAWALQNKQSLSNSPSSGEGKRCRGTKSYK